MAADKSADVTRGACFMFGVFMFILIESSLS